MAHTLCQAGERVPTPLCGKQYAPFGAGPWIENRCQHHYLPKRVVLKNCQQDHKWICKSICMVSDYKNGESICTTFCSQVHKSPFLPEPQDPIMRKSSTSSLNILPGCDPFSFWESGQKHSITSWSNNQHPKIPGSDHMSSKVHGNNNNKKNVFTICFMEFGWVWV